jgi:hypothetical protein
VVRLVEEFNMVNFMPLNIKDEDSIEAVLYQIDHAIQFGEDEEVKETDFGDEGEAMPGENE